MTTKKEHQLTIAVAVVAWLFGAWCTYGTLFDLNPRGNWQLFFVSLGVQLVLSFAQHTVWKWQKRRLILWGVGIPLVLFDVLLNYNELSTYLVRLSVILPIDTTQAYADLLLWLIELFICFLVAAIPELLIGKTLEQEQK